MKNIQRLKTVWNPKGAGRPVTLSKKELMTKIYHRSRPEIPRARPVHVTIKSNKNIIPNLRSKVFYKEIRQGMKRARILGIRIIHFSVQRDHVHMLIEAENKKQLGESMRALSISLSKRFSFTLKKKVKALKNRYHLHILKSLQEIKNATNYILHNGQKHGITDVHDFYSTAINFSDFRASDAFFQFMDDLQSILAPPFFWSTRRGLKMC
jgi:REP element-mobilizing transposase RayT